jgi:hypothetical protein
MTDVNDDSPHPRFGVTDSNEWQPLEHHFLERTRQAPPSENRIGAAQKAYQQHLLLTSFDLRLLSNRLNDLVRLCRENTGRVRLSGVSDMGKLQDASGEQIFKVSKKF